MVITRFWRRNCNARLQVSREPRVFDGLLTAFPNVTKRSALGCLLLDYISFRRRVTLMSSSLIFLRKVLRLMPSKSAHLA